MRTAQVLGTVAMLLPSVAVLITRLATKEGFKNNYLGFSLKGKWKYYLISVFIKPVEALILIVLLRFVVLKDMSLSELVGNDLLQGAALFLLQFAFSVYAFFPAFGEEWGWRGYMMPKLTELMGRPAAVIVGGIIWGLWHAPMTVQGHNFGVDYPGYPYVGIALMCVFCIAMNALLTWLTERTGSIYPASFCHMINNDCNLIIVCSLFLSEQAIAKISAAGVVELFLYSLPVQLTIALYALCCCAKNRKSPLDYICFQLKNDLVFGLFFAPKVSQKAG